MSKLHLACVIDDDRIIRMLSEMLISNYKIADKTVSFENGLTALNYLDQNKDLPELLPELILLDLRMPVVDGWEFMERYATLAPNLSKKITIYIVSSSIDHRDHERAKSLSLVSGFIVKPITKTILQDIADSVQIS